MKTFSQNKIDKKLFFPVSDAPDCSQYLTLDIGELEDSQIEEVETSPSPNKQVRKSSPIEERPKEEVDLIEESRQHFKTYYRVNSRCEFFSYLFCFIFNFIFLKRQLHNLNFTCFSARQVILGCLDYFRKFPGNKKPNFSPAEVRFVYSKFFAAKTINVPHQSVKSSCCCSGDICLKKQQT